jgi:hypothetical protein
MEIYWILSTNNIIIKYINRLPWPTQGRRQKELPNALVVQNTSEIGEKDHSEILYEAYLQGYRLLLLW